MIVDRGEQPQSSTTNEWSETAVVDRRKQRDGLVVAGDEEVECMTVDVSRWRDVKAVINYDFKQLTSVSVSRIVDMYVEITDDH